MAYPADPVEKRGIPLEIMTTRAETVQRLGNHTEGTVFIQPERITVELVHNPWIVAFAFVFGFALGIMVMLLA
jgi:hypothetical protein